MIEYGPGSFGDILTAGIQRFATANATDQIFQANAMLKFLMKSPLRQDGGESIVVPLEIAETDASGFYQGDEQLNTAGNDTLTEGHVNWRTAYAAIRLTKDEIRRVKGGNINLAQHRTKNAMKTLKANIWRAIMASTKANAKYLDPIIDVVKASGATGDIDAATYSWWKSQEIDAANQSFDDVGLNMWKRAYNRASNGGDEPPNVIFTTEQTIEDYESVAVDKLRLRPMEVPDVGFDNLAFRGKPAMWDQLMQTGRTYFLNTESIKLAEDSGDNFEVGKFIQPPNQFVMIALISWRGNIVCTERRKQAYVINQA